MNGIQVDKTSGGKGLISACASSIYGHLFLVLLVELIAYGNLFSIYFLSDDFNLLVGISKWLSPAVEYFRPVPHLVIHFFYKFFGMNVFPYHLLSFLVHYLNAILIYLLLKKIADNGYAALCGSVLFIANFLISEAVFWISAITSLLVTFFYLLTIYFYVHYLSKLNKKYLVLTFIFFICSLLTKENAVTLPALLFSVHLCHNSGLNLRKRIFSAIKGVLPFVVGTTLYLILKVSSLTAALNENTLSAGYHNLRNIRHLLLSFFTFNPFFDLPFIYVDVKILNLFPGLSIQTPAITINIKFVFSLMVGLLILLLCLFILFKGKGKLKLTFWAFLISMGPFVFVPHHHLPFAGHFRYPLRLYYLPAAFFFMFFALLLGSGHTWFKKKGKPWGPIALITIFLPVILIFSDLLKVKTRSADWITAGNITRSVIEQFSAFMPVSQEEKKLVVFNLPDNYRGVYILRNGLQSALKLSYPRARLKIEISQIPPEKYEIPGAASSQGNIMYINCAEAKLTSFLPEKFKKTP